MRREPFDDAYFFKRVAQNALQHGTLAWNVDDGPVYGITSQLFQLAALPITALAGNWTIIVTRVLLALCLAFGFWLLLSLTEVSDGGRSATLCFASPPVLFCVLSGMETALAVALSCAALYLVYAPRAARLHWALAPIAVLLVWLTRPDAVLLLVPALLSERWLRRQRFPAREALTLVLCAAACLLAFKLYYGTALPLPFYAKQLAFSPYGAEFLATSATARVLHLTLFAAAALPLLSVALLYRDSTNLVLAASAVAFAGYHALTTVDVMGMHARFYAPALPVLALAAARAIGRREWSARLSVVLAAAYLASLATLALAGWLPVAAEHGRLERVAAPFYFSFAAAALALFMAPRWRPLGTTSSVVLLAAAAMAALAEHGPRWRGVPSDDDYLQSHASHVTVFRGMSELRACFGPAIAVYHSEIGVPGLRFPQGKVTDLAGLFAPSLLFGEQTADQLCLLERPEAIFLPHKNYAEQNRLLLAGDCLKQYERVVTDSSSPLYVRSDLHARYQRCAATPP